MIGCAYLFQILCCCRIQRSLDQVYSYPAVTGLLCYLVLIVYLGHLAPSSTALALVAILLMIMLGSFYRICFCLEVSKEKQMVAQEKAYTMMENKERYDTMQKENQFIMKNMHDLKKHLELLDHLDSKEDGIQAYRDEIQKKAQELLQYQKTGDLLIDKILQLYHSKFLDAGIQCNIESEDIDYSFMDAVDLCAILCNLLDNAYESCSKCEERFIQFKMRRVSDHILWKMKNSTIEFGINGKSSKQDSLGHGFGLSNIRNTASKYHGELMVEVDREHGVYITMISFQLTDDAGNMTTSV